jgi:hypothetical protein
MALQRNTESVVVPSVAAPPNAWRWLLFVHQLPSNSSNLRVRTWRRLQQVGAVPIKQAVYVLPDSPVAREDFEWLRTEVKASGGDASVFVANHVDAWSDDALIESFRRSAQDGYAALAAEVEETLKRATAARRPRGTRAPAIARLLSLFRERLAAVDAVDFFGSAGRDRVIALVTQLEALVLPSARERGDSPLSSRAAAGSFQGRLWVTRPRPGVDRMASAWLIRRYIDQEARFGFAADLGAVPAAGVPFDMFGVEFSHQGEGCTFETLCRVFGVEHPAIARVATIVHDLDLKDGKFGAPEAGIVGTLVEGLQLAHADDEQLLAQGMAMFDALYRGFEHPARRTGPRPVAKARPRTASKTPTRARRREK